MRSRFTVIPVLFPLREDFPAITVATAERIAPTSQLDIADAEIVEAAGIFYQKGANSRHLRSALSNVLLLSGKTIFDNSTFLNDVYFENTQFKYYKYPIDQTLREALAQIQLVAQKISA